MSMRYQDHAAQQARRFFERQWRRQRYRRILLDFVYPAVVLGLIILLIWR